MKGISAKTVIVLSQSVLVLLGLLFISDKDSLLIFLLLSSSLNYGVARTFIHQVEGITNSTPERITFKEIAFVRNEIKKKIDQADIDSLTQVHNRNSLEKALVNMESQYLSVLMIDLDHFKLINDKYGHFEGDRILNEAGSLLNELVGEIGKVYRYGGEEFVVLIQRDDSKEAEELAEAIRETFRDKLQVGNVAVTASIGMAFGFGFEMVLKMADQSLYFAKQKGRDCVCVY